MVFFGVIIIYIYIYFFFWSKKFKERGATLV